MEFDTTLVASIGGIILGWFLSQISGLFSSRIQRLRCQRRLLRRLVRMHVQLKSLIRMSEHFQSHSQSWKQFESFRTRITTAHFLYDPSELEKTKTAIGEYSAYHPFRALRLDWIVHVLEKAKSQTFDASIEKLDLYMQLLSAHEVVLESVEAELQKEVKKLAWSCGPFTRFALWNSNRKERKNIEGSRPFADQFTKESLEAARETEV